jgi:hypothetical protein
MTLEDILHRTGWLMSLAYGRKGWIWWLITVIPDSQEVMMEKIVFRGQPRQILVRPHFIIQVVLVAHSYNPGTWVAMVGLLWFGPRLAQEKKREVLPEK